MDTVLCCEDMRLLLRESSCAGWRWTSARCLLPGFTSKRCGCLWNRLSGRRRGLVPRKKPEPVIRLHVCARENRLATSPSRYGLPLNYQALLLQTDRKRSKKLEEELSLLFTHLDPTAAACKMDVRGRIKSHFIHVMYTWAHMLSKWLHGIRK